MDPARQRLQGHGVVEVTRRLGVDGHERDVAQVRAIAAVRVLNLAWHVVSGLRHLAGEFIRDIAAGQDLLHFGARILG